MSKTLINIKNFDTSKITYSQAEKAGSYDRLGIGYKGVLEAHIAPNNGAKFKTRDEYLYVSMPPMQCYGLFPTYVYEKERIDENINGWQVIVPLEGETRTKEEQHNIDVFFEIREKLVSFITENQDLMPAPFNTCRPEMLHTLIPNMFSTPKQREGGDDPKETLYIPLIYYNKKGNFGTKVYGPGDYEVNPLKYSKIGGMIEMVLRLNYVSMGKKARIKMELYEANYIPNPPRVHTRMVARNNAPVSDDIEDVVDTTSSTTQTMSETASTTQTSTSSPQEEELILEEEEEMVEVKTKNGPKMITRAKYNELKKKQKGKK